MKRMFLIPKTEMGSGRRLVWSSRPRLAIACAVLGAAAGVLLWQSSNPEGDLHIPPNDRKKGAGAIPVSAQESTHLPSAVPASAPANEFPNIGQPARTETGISVLSVGIESGGGPQSADLAAAASTRQPARPAEDKPMSLLEAIMAAETRSKNLPPVQAGQPTNLPDMIRAKELAALPRYDFVASPFARMRR